MIIEGRELREQLKDLPIGTQFMCVGHWDKSPYYYEGIVYTLRQEMDEDEPYLTLVCDEHVGHEYHGYRHTSGNGYSGTWQRIVPFEGKELEDYL